MQDRKEALEIVKNARYIFAVVGPGGAIKATKESVKALINSPHWPEFRLQELANSALLRRENVRVEAYVNQQQK